MRVVFMGSPEFAVPALRALSGACDVVGVVTRPDRPAGRGQRLHPPPVKVAALEGGIPFVQPPRLADPEAMVQLQTWKPDLIVVAAFGQILRQGVLDLPRHGCINVHASLLPRWRGAAPVQAAILHGDRETGVTLMKMDAGLDTGPILAQRSILIGDEDTGGSLSERLADVGAELLLEKIPDYVDGKLPAVPQQATLATYAPMLTKRDGALDFRRSANELARQVRAFHPWPGSYLEWAGGRVEVWRARVASGVRFPVGDVGGVKGLPAVGTADDALVLEIVQPAGRSPMPAADFARGARRFIGSLVTSPPAPPGKDRSERAC